MVHVAEADETTRPGEDASAYLFRIVRAKLEAVVGLADAAQAWGAARGVLVADTSVILDGAILGKPADVDDAERMVASLAGRSHEVWTRFAIGAAEAPVKVLHEETVITKVTFRALTRAQIRAYAESGEGRDKAGAYAVQGRGSGLALRLEGSYANVVGLPACEVMMALESLGLVA